MPAAAQRPTLHVYTYSSFVSWGPGQQIKEGFEELYDVDLVFVAPGGGGSIVGRVVTEMASGSTAADVVLGIPEASVPEALNRNLFVPYDPKRIAHLQDVPAEFHVDSTNRLAPFNFAYIALVYDPQRLDVAPPESLSDLTDPRFGRKLIAMDVSSAPGQAFILWTIAEFGEDGYIDFWERLKPSLLTVTSSWSIAYNMFTEGEAPIVVSYSTDGVYAAMDGLNPPYQVLMPGGQGYRQVETMGIVRTTDQPELAHAFLDYVLSPEVQALIATTNVVFPVNPKAELPDLFTEHAIVPPNPVSLGEQLGDAPIDTWFRNWTRMIAR